MLMLWMWVVDVAGLQGVEGCAGARILGWLPSRTDVVGWCQGHLQAHNPSALNLCALHAGIMLWEMAHSNLCYVSMPDGGFSHRQVQSGRPVQARRSKHWGPFLFDPLQLPELRPALPPRLGPHSACRVTLVLSFIPSTCSVHREGFPGFHEGIPAPLQELITQCISQDSSARPTSSQAKTQLQVGAGWPWPRATETLWIGYAQGLYVHASELCSLYSPSAHLRPSLPCRQCPT